MELAEILEPTGAESPLASARLQRKLTLEDAAARAGLSREEATWLEEGRVYRFASPDDALLALLVYATGLGIDHREARELAGLPVPPREIAANPLARVAVLAAVAAALVALVAAFTLPRDDSAARARAEAALPPPWKIHVDVLNGAGDHNWTFRYATKIGALGYQIDRVRKADRFDYRQTAVYYERGGGAVAARLARQLDAVAKPLPGGDNPRRLVVIVGPPRGPG